MDNSEFKTEASQAAMVGRKVRTTVDGGSSDWGEDAKAARQWNVTGNSHGLVFGVRHDDDDTLGFYEPREIIREG